MMQKSSLSTPYVQRKGYFWGEGCWTNLAQDTWWTLPRMPRQF